VTANVRLDALPGTPCGPQLAHMALKLAAEGSKHCNRKIEVRPFL